MSNGSYFVATLFLSCLLVVGSLNQGLLKGSVQCSAACSVCEWGQTRPGLDMLPHPDYLASTRQNGQTQAGEYVLIS